MSGKNEFEKEMIELEIEQIVEALESDSIDVFRSLFLDIHPYDQAKVFRKLPQELRVKLYHFLSPEEMA